VYKLFLFTGKVGYAVVEKPSYLIDLVIIWVGNFIGTFAIGQLMLYTRAAEALSAKAVTLCQTKLDDNLVSILVLAIFCGIMMFLAADNFSTADNSMQKNLGIFLPVMVFILCGFEHCVANMFYFTIANMWSVKAFSYLIIMTLGNSVGAFIFPLYRKVLGDYL
jgi:formate/nitrite transporter FocA (FNT family)